MKLFKLIFVLLSLLLLACNPKDDKTTSSTLPISDSTSVDNIPEEVNPEDDDKLAGYKIDNINNVIALFQQKDIDKIASIITTNSIEKLGIITGSQVSAIIKASDVMIGK